MSTRKAFIVVSSALGAAAIAMACVSSSPIPSLGSSSGGGSGGGAGEDSGGGSSGGSGGSSGGASSSSSGGGSGSSSGGTSSGGGSDASAGTDGGATACTYTLTGGITANGSCTAVGAYAANNSITEFGITPSSSSPVFALQVRLGTTPSAFQTGTYTPANVVNATGEYVVVSGTSAETWIFTDNDAGADGGFTLDLTSTGVQYTTDGGVAWPAPHGTVTVTLNPGTGATQQVTGTATF